jgi:hypothetical protein
MAGKPEQDIARLSASEFVAVSQDRVLLFRGETSGQRRLAALTVLGQDVCDGHL